MTIAICIDCGVEKKGALTPCSICGYKPETKIDKAKSMLLSDHYLSQIELKMVSEQIREE